MDGRYPHGFAGIPTAPVPVTLLDVEIKVSRRIPPGMYFLPGTFSLAGGLAMSSTVTTLGQLAQVTGVPFWYLRAVVERKTDPYISLVRTKRDGTTRPISASTWAPAGSSRWTSTTFSEL